MEMIVLDSRREWEGGLILARANTRSRGFTNWLAQLFGRESTNKIHRLSVGVEEGHVVIRSHSWCEHD